jgi:hypothetical protein
MRYVKSPRSGWRQKPMVLLNMKARFATLAMPAGRTSASSDRMRLVAVIRVCQQLTFNV